MQHPGKKPEPLDIALGARVRARRKTAGIDAHDMAAAIDVSYQQLQKYESGENRLGFSRLAKIAARLGVTVEELIGGLVASPGLAATTRRDVLLKDADANEMLTAFVRVRSRKARRSLIDLAKGLED